MHDDAVLIRECGVVACGKRHVAPVVGRTRLTSPAAAVGIGDDVEGLIQQVVNDFAAVHVQLGKERLVQDGADSLVPRS